MNGKHHGIVGFRKYTNPGDIYFFVLFFCCCCSFCFVFKFFFPKRNGANDSESKEKWYKFNDIFVEEFDMNEDTLEAECFGGTYKATVYDTGE